MFFIIRIKNVISLVLMHKFPTIFELVNFYFNLKVKLIIFILYIAHVVGSGFHLLGVYEI